MQPPIATSTQVANQEWLVILPDNTPQSLPLRLSHHTPHFEAAKPDVASGFFSVAGKLYEDAFKEGEPHRIAGTFLIVRAQRREDVVRRLKADLFYEKGVWKWEELRIWPCKATFSQGRGGGEGGL